MSINVIPEKMEQGKITSISIKVGTETEEIYTIPPTPFENFEAMKIIIEKYKGIEDLWKKAKQETDDATSRFNLVDFKYRAAKQDFDLLIDPKKEPVIITQKQPKAVEPQKEPEPQPQKEPQTGQASVTILIPPTEPSRVIVSPPNPTELAKQASMDMQTRAEQNEKDFQKGIAPIVQEFPNSPLSKMMRERPALLTSNLQDIIPEKANRVLTDISERLDAAQELTDLTKPIRKSESMTASDWVVVIEPKMTERLGNGETEFTQEEMEQMILEQGVPKKLVEKVSRLLIQGWEKDDRFEKEIGLLTKAKEYVFGKKKKKEE